MTKIVATVIGINSTLAMPTADQRAASGSRGNKLKYDLSKLAIGTSLGVKDSTAKKLSSTVSENNAKEWPVLKADGSAEKTAKKDAAGNVVKGADGKPEMVDKTEKRVFFAVNCTNDPEGADARIWREK